jgi:hypothetical protein
LNDLQAALDHSDRLGVHPVADLRPGEGEGTVEGAGEEVECIG